MPKKIRELIQDLQRAGFQEILGGKGSHRKFVHINMGDKTMKASDNYHKWIEWNDEDQVYIGKCPDLITGIHGDDPIILYNELCEVVEDVIHQFEIEGRKLPISSIRPMREVVG